MKEGEYLSMTDAARVLGLTRQRVHQLHHDGLAPCPDLWNGHRPFWKISTVESWKEARNRKKQAWQEANR